jgi:uncharacterized SAM-binding protein YcdF (DUF218 family)
MDFYHLLLKCAEPTSLCVACLVMAACLRKHKVGSRVLFWLPVAMLMVCGNRPFSDSLIRRLERQYLPPNPMPQADCILILGGGTEPELPPRPTVEVNDAGDRVLYGAWLYRLGKAPLVLCTGGGHEPHPEALDMADILQRMGVPKDAILLETKAMDTHDHALNLRTEFHQRGFKRILLVTSAMHMPRSVAVFKRGCPGVEFIPAPTDFRAPDDPPRSWCYRLSRWVPTPLNLLTFSDASHEYMGMLYYRLRGWV